MKQFYTDWDEFKDAQLCNAWVAAAIVGAGALGAGATIFGANSAADAQKNASQTAADTQLTMYNTTRGDLAPYRDAGSYAAGKIQDPVYSTIDKFEPPTDQASLEATPGYQFTKTQGLKAVANSAAARGLGVSGAALKGAANFATGLADNTYQQNFDRAATTFNTNLASKSAAYSRLSDLLTTGENAAAGTGKAGSIAASGAAGAQIGAGNAQAAAYNATGGAVNSFANNVGGYAAYKGLYGSTPGYDTTNGMQPTLDAQAASTRVGE